MRLKQMLLIVKNSTQKVFVVNNTCEKKNILKSGGKVLKVHKHPSPQLETGVLAFFIDCHGHCTVSSLSARVFACMAGAPCHFTLLYLPGAHWGQKRSLDPVSLSLELELEVAVNCWVHSAWTELGTPFHLYSFSISRITMDWENKSLFQTSDSPVSITKYFVFSYKKVLFNCAKKSLRKRFQFNHKARQSICRNFLPGGAGQYLPFCKVPKTVLSSISPESPRNHCASWASLQSLGEGGTGVWWPHRDHTEKSHPVGVMESPAPNLLPAHTLAPSEAPRSCAVRTELSVTVWKWWLGAQIKIPWPSLSRLSRRDGSRHSRILEVGSSGWVTVLYNLVCFHTGHREIFLNGMAHTKAVQVRVGDLR